MPCSLADAQLIEFLHLAFLQVSRTRLDQSRYAVKGGAALRYFFASPRYSEGLDLDAIEIEPWKLEEAVDAVFASPAVALLLRSGDLALEDVTKSKQTKTTQRWKALVTAGEHRRSVRTKIEVSHRSADPRRVLEAVPQHVVAPYGLRPPTMQHYTPDAAIEQKLGALTHRREPQARDLFDLELLLRRHPEVSLAHRIDQRLLEAALDRVFELPYEAFCDQVRPFLDPVAAEIYDDSVAWERAQAFVAERLMELQQ